MDVSEDLPAADLDFSHKEVMMYLQLITTSPEIKALLNHDGCCRVADNYLLALVFIYLKRAHLESEEFSDVFFFLALLLAHDLVEEDVEIAEEIKYFILPYQRNDYNLRKQMEYVKFLLFQAMGFRGYVSRSTCEKVMSAVPHPLWERQRDAAHGGTRHEICVPEEGTASQYDWYSSSCINCRTASLELMNHEKTTGK